MLADAAIWLGTAVAVAAIVLLPWSLTRARRRQDAGDRARKPFVLPPPD